MKLEHQFVKRNSELRLEMFTNSRAGANVFARRRKGEGEVETNRKQGYSADFSKQKGSWKKESSIVLL